MTNHDQQIKEAIEILKRGGVIAFPTDTLYGLGAAISSAEAVKRVFAIKGRELGQALPVLLAGVDEVDEVAASFPLLARCLVERFWPGALTIILRKSGRVSHLVSGGADTIGVRVPNHPVALALIRGLGEPLTGTSANLSGVPPAKTASEVRRQLGDKIDYIVDAGPPPRGAESTVVDATGRVPVIVREGAIKLAEIERACREGKGVN